MVYLVGNILKSNGWMMRVLKESFVIVIFDLIYFKKDIYF